MAETKSLLEKKFLLEKKSIKMEDCIMFIEQFHADDKSWFYHLCTDEVETTDKNGNTSKGVRPWLSVKKAFYEKYFPSTGELSRRMKLFADWNIDE